jgi:DNA (cytosine-5)-methyltransferase 1
MFLFQLKHDSSARYTIADEEDEDENLVVPGESQISDALGDKPVRILSEFALFEEDSRQFVDMRALEGGLGSGQRNYVASGLVRPWSSSDGDDYDSENEEGTDTDMLTSRITLSTILSVNYHDVPVEDWEGCRRGRMDK